MNHCDPITKHRLARTSKAPSGKVTSKAIARAITFFRSEKRKPAITVMALEFTMTVKVEVTVAKGRGSEKFGR